eukprot:COSAG02_NODE_648_length_18943_cov_924.526746_10_plen_146_part_00
MSDVQPVVAGDGVVGAVAVEAEPAAAVTAEAAQAEKVSSVETPEHEEEVELDDWRSMKTNELNEVTTYYPTMEEFADFEGYMSRPDVWASGMAHGIVKIQPPKEWLDKQHDFGKDGIPQHILGTNIPSPAQQLANGRKGIYECVP